MGRARWADLISQHKQFQTLYPNHSNPVVVAIGDVDIAFPVNRTAMRPVQSSLGGVSPVAFGTMMSAGDRRNYAGAYVYAPDGVVFGIYHYDVILPVAPNGLRCTPSGQKSRSVISAVSPLAVAGQGRHDPLGVNFADPVTLPLGNVGIPTTVLADGPGAQNAGLQSWQTIALPGLLSVTSKCADYSAGQIQTGSH